MTIHESTLTKLADVGLWDWNPATDDLVFDQRWDGMRGYESKELPHEFETMRRMVHGEAKPIRSVSMDIFACA